MHGDTIIYQDGGSGNVGPLQDWKLQLVNFVGRLVLQLHSHEIKTLACIMTPLLGSHSTTQPQKVPLNTLHLEHY